MWSGKILVFFLNLFSFLFYYLSASEQTSFFKQKEINTIIYNPNIVSYDNLNYYLNTKIKVNRKETSLSELIPLYCDSKDKELLTYIQRISLSLLPERSYLKLSCLYNTYSCNSESFTKDKFLPIILITTSKVTPVGSVLLEPNNILNINLPSLTNKNTICLDLGTYQKESPNLHYKRNLILYNNKIGEIGNIPVPLYKVAQSSSEKEFKENLNNIMSNTGEISLSPTKDLWINNENDEWCNAVNTDCSKGISKEKLIECNGDYETCFN